MLLLFFKKISFLCKLPGDMHIKKANVDVLIRAVARIVLSLLIDT